MDSGIRMYDYHVWANRRMLSWLRDVPESALTAPLQSVFPSIYEALVHLYTVDHAWLIGMQGLTFDEMRVRLAKLAEETAGRSLQEWEGLFEHTDDLYRSFIAEVPDLQETREFPHPAFGTLKASISELLHHIANHGTYHRGHICAMLRQQGYPGPSTDYVFFLYEVNQ